MSRKAGTIFLLMCAWVSAGYAKASTPWERYLQEPTAANARAAIKVEYSGVAMSDAALVERMFSDMGILEYEVAAGEAQSILLAFRVYAQFPRSGALSEALSQLAARGIRTNPSAYLSAVRSIGGECVGIQPAGDLFVDRMAAREVEAMARRHALDTVSARDLRREKTRCQLELEVLPN